MLFSNYFDASLQVDRSLFTELHVFIFLIALKLKCCLDFNTMSCTVRLVFSLALV